MIVSVIKAMIERVDQRSRDKLFDVVTVWLEEKKVKYFFDV